MQVLGGEDLGDGTLEFRDRDSIVIKVARPGGLPGEAETRSDSTHTTKRPGEDGRPRSRSRSPPGSLRRLPPVEGESSAADTVGSDSLAGAVRGKTCAADSGSRNSMCNLGVSVHHARPSCRPEDTSADCGPVAVLGVEVGPAPCRRPLPTPCRSSVQIHRRPHCQDPLRTTLELCDPVDRFCHMSRVLAFLDKPPRTGQSLPDGCIPTHSPRVVCLSELVGPTTFDLTRTQVPIGKTLGDLQDILVFDFGNSWHKALPGFDVLHPSTVAAVRDCQLAQQQGCRPDGLCVYTDGSYDGTVSGWSIVCVACCGDRPVDVCWMHGRVEVDAAHPRWLGAAAHGAQEAELTAVAVALLWGQPSLHPWLGLLGRCQSCQRSVAYRSLQQAGPYLSGPCTGTGGLRVQALDISAPCAGTCGTGMERASRRASQTSCWSARARMWPPRHFLLGPGWLHWTLVVAHFSPPVS